MKHVYFVRHGQTEKNVQHIHQGPYEPLTQVGKEQISATAKVLAEKNIDALITSPFTRAIESAAILSDELKLPFSESAAVTEFRRPDSLYGRSHYSIGSAKYLARLFWQRTSPRWDYEGAENMFAIRNRIIDTKRLIEQTKGGRIVVVSHAIFIDMFAQAACADRALTFWEFFNAILGAKKLPNGGVVSFTLDENAPAGTCKWSLLTNETDNRYLQYK